jgi:hypothetical protein
MKFKNKIIFVKTGTTLAIAQVYSPIRQLILGFGTVVETNTFTTFEENIMSIKLTVLSTLFASSIAFTGAAQAQQSPVEIILNNALETAMQSVTAEINEEVQKSILVASSNFQFAKIKDPTLPATTVTITDIAKVKTDSDVNLVEKSDD